MKRIALLLAVLASIALLVPTVANPQFEESSVDQVSENLVMEPADGPNGDYGILNEEDEIELLLTDTNPAVDGDGINDGGVIPIARVFTITYTGERSAEVWITDDAEDVHFFRGDDPENDFEGANDSVVLRPDETIAVGVLVDATDPDNDVEQANTFTVHARIADGATATPTEEAAVVGDAPTATTTDADEGPTSTSEPSKSPTSSPTPTPAHSTDGRANGTQTTTDRTTAGTTSIPGGSADGDRSPTPTSETEKSVAAGRDRPSSPAWILELLPIWLLIALVGLLAAILRRRRE